MTSTFALIAIMVFGLAVVAANVASSRQDRFQAVSLLVGSMIFTAAADNLLEREYAPLPSLIFITFLMAAFVTVVFYNRRDAIS